MQKNIKPTFNLPNFDSRYLKGYGANSEAVGTYGSQTLPNITGSINSGTNTGIATSANGALSVKNAATISGGSSSGYYRTIEFNASNSNTVYGNYNVNPFHVIMMVCIKY